MTRNTVTLIVVILFIAGVVYYGSRNARTAAHVNNGQALSGDDVRGKQAPNFTLADLDGKSVSLTDFRGKAVLLNFWATWCGPCKVEMPWLVDLQKQYRPQGLEIVGVAMDDSGRDTIKDFTNKMGVNYTVLVGKEAVGEAYGGVLGLPTTFYIDRSGKIVDSNAGLISKSEIEDEIKKALNSAATPATSTSNGRSAAAPATQRAALQGARP